MTKNLVDSCGWLEYFTDGVNADFFASALEDIEHLIVPTLCIAEVFKVLLRERNENIALSAISAMNQGKLIELTMELAIDAAKIGLSYKLPLADSVIYATAKAEGALLWTQDTHFENLAGVRFTS
jgi:predicted nucleic acid-binding protein